MISARNYWSTDDLWKDYNWRMQRAAVCSHPHKNWEEMRAAASFNVLVNRRPCLRTPDKSAMDAIEGRTWFARPTCARSETAA